MSRFSRLDIAELQQLYLALHHAGKAGLIADGPGNLFPALKEEVGKHLNERIAATKKDQPSVFHPDEKI